MHLKSKVKVLALAWPFIDRQDASCGCLLEMRHNHVSTATTSKPQPWCLRAFSIHYPSRTSRAIAAYTFPTIIMSFGFAVSDFIAAGKLIKDIIAILRTSARSEYQELMLELHGLQRALYQIEHLEAPPEQQISIVSIKVAALMCTHVLNEFAGKLKKFESLAGQPGNSRLKMWTQKLRWGFTMADEVRNLRAYVSAHVGSLNMRLLTEGLLVIFLPQTTWLNQLTIAQIFHICDRPKRWKDPNKPC